MQVNYARRDTGELASRDHRSRLQRRNYFGFLSRKRNSLFLFVIIPSVVFGIYYSSIASGQFVSETRMIVRTIGVSERFDESEKREGRSIIGGDSLTQDSYIVANYLKSPELVRKLDLEMGLRNFFSSGSIDSLSRLESNASLEELYRYWIKHVDTYVDGPSGIIIFTVRAFSPQASQIISSAALSAADNMIARISERAKNDLVARGESDVLASLEHYQDALDAMRDYQNKTGIFDPATSAKMTTAIIAKLTEEKLKVTVDLKSLEAAGADNTARGRQLRRSIQALEQEIQLRQNSLAGSRTSGDTQLSTSMTEFSRLETRRIVTQALYEAAIRNLDTAKSAALKRTTFIAIFSASHPPEKAEYPDRFSEWIVLTAGLLTVWVTATLIWLSIEDHRI